MAITHTTTGKVVNLIRMANRSNAGELQVLFIDDSDGRNKILLVSTKVDRKAAMRDLKWDKSKGPERVRAKVTFTENETTNTKMLIAYTLEAQHGS